MTKDAWLTKAKKLAATCSTEHKNGNGATKCTTPEAKTNNELSHAVNSDHGIHETSYSAMGLSLQKMINLVKAGTKDQCFK